MKEEKEVRRFVLSEAGIPWEIGPGFLKMVGDTTVPKSDADRARLTGGILSGASDISKEEALRVREEINAALREPTT